MPDPLRHDPLRPPRRAFVAALLSCLVPGLGQLYNGKARRAIALYLGELALGLAIFFPNPVDLFHSCGGLAIYFGLAAVAALGWLAVLTEATFSARKIRGFVPRPYNRWYCYLLIALVNWFLIMPLTTDGLMESRSIAIKENFRPFRIPSKAMEPTLQVGDHIITDLKYYQRKTLARGDLVVFPYPKDPSVFFIKRVVALGGEKVEIRGASVLVNGEPLTEPWGEHYDATLLFGMDFGPVMVAEDSVFLLGDNRNNSRDSRAFGSIETSKIVGKALFIYWADDRDRICSHLR